MEEFKQDQFRMEIYKSTADLRFSSHFLLKLFNEINNAIKERELSSKFIIWIDGDYLLFLVQLSILILPKANNLLKDLLFWGREKIPQKRNLPEENKWLNWTPALNCHFESNSLFSDVCKWISGRGSSLTRQKLTYRNTHFCVLLAL